MLLNACFYTLSVALVWLAEVFKYLHAFTFRFWLVTEAASLNSSYAFNARTTYAKIIVPNHCRNQLRQ